MTATQTRPATGLSPLVAGIRTAVESHADWAETAQLVADQLRLRREAWPADRAAKLAQLRPDLVTLACLVALEPVR